MSSWFSYTQSTHHQFNKPVILIRLHVSDSAFVFVTDNREKKLPAAYPFCTSYHSTMLKANVN
jgi:hypothetical protein